MVKTESTVSNNYNNKVSTASMNVRALSSYVRGHVVIVLALSYFVKTI